MNFCGVNEKCHVVITYSHSYVNENACTNEDESCLTVYRLIKCALVMFAILTPSLSSVLECVEDKV